MRVNSSRLLPMLWAVLTPSLLLAQVPPPDAGALRQQIERQQTDRAFPESSAPLQTMPPEPLQIPDGMTLTVNAFRFAGNTLLAEAQLQPIVQPWLNRALGFAELQRAAAAVAHSYRNAGWIAFAFLPQQDVTDGIVTIRITESRFAGARIEGMQATRMKSELALQYVHQETGQPLSAPRLDRALLLINDLPGVSVAGALSAGARPAETELLLRLSDERLIDGHVRFDNSGARFTGEERVRMSLGVNSPLGIGDRARADLLHSDGSDYARLGYSVPVGTHGWQAGVNGSYFEYELTGIAFEALDGNGRSTSIGADANYPLLRSRLSNLYFTFAADQRKFRNEALGVLQSRYTIGSVTMGLAGSLHDSIAGGGSTSFNLSWTSGHVNQHAPEVGENPALDGNFGKLTFGASRQQLLTSTLSLYAAVNGQYSDDALDSAERYYLGGPDGVRAYPVNDGGGSRALLANLELRWVLHPAFTATAFEDWGHVTNPGAEPDYSLSGLGMSLEWQAARGVQLEATYASRDGRNRNASPDGAYQDGSRGRGRWWLQATMAF